MVFFSFAALATAPKATLKPFAGEGEVRGARIEELRRVNFNPAG
jgi:hypothetical protein